MTPDLPTFLHDTRRVVSCNAAAAELFRCDPVGLTDVDMADLIATDDMRGLARLRLGVMRDGEHWPLPDIRYPFRRCDGSVFWARLMTLKKSDGLFETSLMYEGEEE